MINVQKQSTLSQNEILYSDKGNNSSSKYMDSSSEIQSQMNQCSTQQIVNEHQERVDEIVTKISQALDNFQIDVALGLMTVERISQYQYSVFLDNGLKFRIIMTIDSILYNDVQFQLLAHYADTIMRFININKNHISVTKEFQYALPDTSQLKIAQETAIYGVGLQPIKAQDA